MAFTIGSRLGPYEILAPLGAGGMGEVYRARDPRLGRDVAIKVLPASYSADPDRLRRFEQEARAAGLLNHPNVMAVYDVGSDEAGEPYVVSELLEGETLRSALAGGALAPRRAVDYALQIAHGLAAAHEKGILHRDLKPENLFVTNDGRVKILDFGLAKLVETPEGTPVTGLPTATAHGAAATEPGVVLGTLGYMSPEQVRGRGADARSDIFSFGAILYEMLSGRRAFQGDSAADTMSAILREDPPELSLTNQSVSPGLERVIRHCLEKNPEQRFHSAHDLAFDLEALSGISASRAVASAPARSASFSRAGWLAGASAICLAAGFAAGRLRSGSAVPPTVRAITYSGKDSQPAASPDGRTIAFVSKRDGRNRIWLKQLSGGGEAALTDGPTDQQPRFSPDGASILFARGTAQKSDLFRIALVGGEPRRLIEDARDGEWSPDGKQIVFLRPHLETGLPRYGIWIAAADGASPRAIAEYRNIALRSPRWSPDGKTIVVARDAGPLTEPGVFELVSVDGREHRTISPPHLLGDVSAPAWDRDRILYAEAASITVTRASSGRVLLQKPSSSRADVLLNVPNFGLILDILGPGRIVFDADLSRQNLREYTFDASLSLVSEKWITRGNGADRQPAYSPDGKWVIFASDRTENFDIWKYSTATGELHRLTEDPGTDWDPAFTPDGKRILWSSNRTGHFEIWSADADGSGARQISRDGVDAENPSETPDGRWIIYSSNRPGEQGVWKVHPDGTEASLVVRGGAIHAEISPDGQYVLFHFSQQALHVARLADGKVLPYTIPIHSFFAVGRARWMPDGKGIAFEALDSENRNGLVWQAFSPDVGDTSASRRPLAGFDPDAPTESFGISPDGRHMILSNLEERQDIQIVEGLSGVVGRARN